MGIRERMGIRKEKKEYQGFENKVAKWEVRTGKRLRKRTQLGLPLTNEEREVSGKIMEEKGRDALRFQKQQRWKTSIFWRFVRRLGGK